MARGYRSGIATGLALSAGTAALFGPLWQPVMARWGRPAVKGVLKGGLAAYEVARMRLAEMGEKAQDLLVEAQIERSTERSHAGAPFARAPAAEPSGAHHQPAAANPEATPRRTASAPAGEAESVAPARSVLDASLAT